jgi:hypothetical protein
LKKLVVPSTKDATGAYTKTPAFEPFKLSKFLFDKQLKFVEDPRPFKVAVCSRRAGKTVACAAHLVHIALNNPESVSLYITLSRNNAKKLIWRELMKFNRDFHLNADQDETELSMTFPNKAVIYCSGAKDATEIEKFRGLALKICYIDECQSFRDYIQELIDDIISPALMDYAGTLCLIGTPGPLPVGYFAEVAGAVEDAMAVSEAWSLHQWTYFDNPFIPAKSHMTHQALLDRELKRRGVTVADPSIQREWFGRWVADSDSLLIHYDRAKNHFVDLPGRPEDYSYIMGIDLGFDDADAIAILAFSDKSPVTYLVDELVVHKQGLTELVGQINIFNTKYKVCKMMIDQGGLGKKIAEEMRRQHGIPVQPADKARKMENVKFLNDALRTGRFKAKATSIFVHDTYFLERDRSKSRPDKVVVSNKFHSDIIDAVLYPFKESPAWAFQAEPDKPKYGTQAWAEAQQDSMFEAAREHFEQQAELERRINSLGNDD